MRKAIVKSLITLALATSVGVHANSGNGTAFTVNSTINSTLKATATTRGLLAGSNTGTALSKTAAIALPSATMLGAKNGLSATGDAGLLQWSNLPTIALGLIGLVWVRRHVAQL